jgi:RimJ/RimL family protein N-acetyltransferase
MAVNAARDVFGESVVIRQISRSDGLVSLASEFRAADLAIGAAGSSSWERVCLGLPSVVVPIAQNQLAVARELHRRGFAMVVEPQGTQLEQQILLALTRFTDGEELAAMAERCWSSEIDGLGALRVGIAAASHLLALTMRPVVLSDADRLLDWRNDPLVVSNSQSHNRIDIDEHEHWLKETLARPDLHRWMIATVSDQVAIGQVRFDLREGCWWMTYSVDQKFRGLGVGVALIKAGLRILAEERVSHDVAAVVRASNQASLKTLDRVGFRRSTRSTLYEYANASNLRDLEVHLFDLRRDA